MAKGRGDARYLNLRMEPDSAVAQDFVNALAEEAWAKGPSKRKKPPTTFIVALGALVADLLKLAAYAPERFAYRSMKASAFTGERIGYRSFKRAVDDCQAANLITVRKGTGGGKEAWVATRFKATPTLLERAECAGLILSEWQRNFRPIPRPRNISDPVVLKSDSSFTCGWKRDGRPMGFARTDPVVRALIKQVNDINEFFATVRIEHDSEHYAFQRIFNQGDLSSFAWDKGGRLYSMGDSYQHRKAPDRTKMKLNGESVVEIDIQASHLTILHAKLGMLFEPAKGDPYAHPTIPRRVLKGWVVMTLGHDKFHRAWSPDMKAEYLKSTGGDLGKDYPIKMVREEALKLLPLLDGWPSCPIRWGDLQYIESCAVVDTVHQLAMEHNVPALPVHDSIIVPKSKSGLASAVLVENFTKYVGVEPILCIK